MAWDRFSGWEGDGPWDNGPYGGTIWDGESLVPDYYLPLFRDLSSDGGRLGTGTTGRASGAMYCDGAGIWQSSPGDRENILLYSEDTSNWTGSGPWTQSVAVTAPNTYVLSVHKSGPTVTAASGTGTIAAGASATYGSADTFRVTSSGNVTITTDTADPKAQIELVEGPALGTSTAIVDDDCADDDTGDWSIAVDAVNSVIAFDTDHYELSSNGDANEVFYLAATLTAEKWYVLQVDLKDGTEAAETIDLVNTDGGVIDSSTQFTTGAASATCQHMFLADSTSDGVGIRIPADLSGDNIEIQNVKLFDATSPGPLTPSPYTATSGSAASIVVPGRFHHISDVNKGLCLEQTQTNWVTYSNDLTNAAWVESNVTTAKDQTGPDGVANSASLLTADANNGTCLQTLNLASDDFYFSVFAKRVTGTGTVYMTDDNDTNRTEITLTSAWTRFDVNRTQADPVVGFKLATSGDEIAVWCAQVEPDYVSSPIPTQDIPIARAADDHAAWTMSAAFKAIFESGGKGTVVADVTPMLSQAAQDAVGSTGLVSVKENLGGLLYFTDSGAGFITTLDSDSNFDNNDYSFVAGTTFQAASKFLAGANGLELAMDGSFTGSPGTYGGAFTLGNNLNLFHTGTGSWCFKNIRVYKEVLSASELKSLL